MTPAEMLMAIEQLKGKAIEQAYSARHGGHGEAWLDVSNALGKASAILRRLDTRIKRFEDGHG